MVNFSSEIFKSNYAKITDKDVDKTFKGLDYISWATAWKNLMLVDAEASYKILENENGGYIFEDHGCLFVKTEVTAFGKTIPMTLPIMDSNHNSVKTEAYQVKLNNGMQNVPALNSRIVTDCTMRCLAKNIAMFGLGLSLYIKDKDGLPNDEDQAKDVASSAKSVTQKPEPKSSSKTTATEKKSEAQSKENTQGVAEELIAEIQKKSKTQPKEKIAEFIKRIKEMGGTKVSEITDVSKLKELLAIFD